jgi:hypothetical protein
MAGPTPPINPLPFPVPIPYPDAVKGPFRFRLLLTIAALTVLVTGCPHDEYTVDLQPHGNAIERTLTFFRVDGMSSNDTPNYQPFDTNQLLTITALYPPDAVTESSNHWNWTARGTFAGRMPSDIGGAGTYSNYTTSLGSASIYTERFRGNDDIATSTETRLRAANILADHILAWSKMELGSQPDYANLRRFLDTDFRRDLKNLALYWWLGNIADNERPDGNVEYFARVGQYLVEHHYLQLRDLSQLQRAFGDNDMDRVCRILQRVIARKLDIPDSAPLPAALKFLDNPDTLEASWEKYLSTTPEYRHRLSEWHRQRALATWMNPGYLAHNAAGIFNRTLTNAPGPPRPQPSEIVQTNLENLAQLDYQPEADVVTVNLALPAAPLHSNGKWDIADGRVKWKRDIEQPKGLSPLPAFFFAIWAQPDESFQTAHFGGVRVSGDNLFNYCLWHAALSPNQAAECDAFLASLQPDTNLTAKINAFRFSDEARPASTNTPVSNTFQNFLKNTPP